MDSGSIGVRAPEGLRALSLGRTSMADSASGGQLGEIAVSEKQPVSWRSIIYGTPVISSDQEPAGHVHEVLGDDAEDIFHGLRVALVGGHRDVLVSVDHVASISADQVRVDLTRSALDALPTYDEEATYHLASVGWLRKHIGWQKDSKGDEEPG
jgi:hypothetical protein